MTGVGAVFMLMSLSILGGVALLIGYVFFQIFRAFFWSLAGLGRGLGYSVKGLGRLVGGTLLHLSRFVRRELTDSLHTAGALLTAAVISPLAVLNLLMGRCSTAKHYGYALEDELIAAGRGAYRVVLGNPIRLLGLGTLTEGIERRVPGMIDRAPRGASGSLQAAFSGYKLLDVLPSGGSGAKLYIARPNIEKVAAFAERGHIDPGKVVIKSFALEEGSTLPQIVRETRALEAASRLGLVLEHDLSPRRFYYVMPFVPGDDLGRVTGRLHAHADSEGLAGRELQLVMGYAANILQSLERFHSHGLWHKDIKPTNLIVADGRAHIVDLGLVTPLQSAMTLTTHGTEYYRDPEMVRLAMRGVKVHEVDGVKFDLYSVGAVLYSMIENSFPAHGSLSRISKRCPESLAWIVRRSMADLDARYSSAREMLSDLAAVQAAPDLFAMRPADLPSVHGALRQQFAREAGVASAADPLQSTLGSSTPLPEVEHAIAAAPVERLRRRRRARPLAAVALALVGGMFVVQAQRSRASAVHHAHARMESQAESILGWDRESQGVATAWQEADSPSDTALPAPRLEAEELRRDYIAQAWRTRLGQHFEAHPALAGGERVLVLETPTMVLDTQARTALDDALSGYGCKMLGAPASDDLPNEDIVAEALHAVALSGPDDALAVERLQEWLDAERRVQRVIWLARDPSSGKLIGHILCQELRAAIGEDVLPSARKQQIELR